MPPLHRQVQPRNRSGARGDNNDRADCGHFMTLKSRLSRLQAQAGHSGTDATSKPTVSQLRRRLANLRQQQPFAPAPAGSGALPVEALAERLGGELIAGGVIRIHNRIPLAELPGCGNQCTPDPVLPGEDGAGSHRNIYIDTETTGLSGGSGTIAFLIGIAVVTEPSVELTQFLLTRFSAESALLSSLSQCLSPDDRLVSYNGKSFDLPLLHTRYRMQALAQPLGGLPHLDLLHPVRRLFGRRWPDCRLLTLERELLGFSRDDDLPGSEAPMAWFDYVRRRHAGGLVRIVEHNRQDIASLPAAHSALARAVAEPQASGVDLPALARWLAEYNEAAARALLHQHAATLCNDGRRLLGHYCRRAGDWPQAVALWDALAASGCTDSLLRLAKYHEHISGDLDAARECCDRLPMDAALAHRRRRIDRKLGT